VTFTNTFDSLGRRTNLADSRGGSIAYTYDAADRQTSAKLTVNSVAGPGATFTYDNADRLTGITR
jgi:YD repeat-containing protein